MPLHWHVDGKKVHLDDGWEATSTSAGGYEQLTATADREELRGVHQGSHITAYTDGGREVWSGTIDATPAVSRLETLNLTATGPVSRLRRQRAGLLYQSRDYGRWKPRGGDPHNYAADDDITVDTQAGRLAFRASQGQDVNTNDVNGVCAWFPGERISRVAFDWVLLAGTSQWCLRLHTAAGPSGAQVQRGSDFVTGAGGSGSVDETIPGSSDHDLVMLSAVRTGATAAPISSTFALGITNLRVNGRTALDEVAPGAIIGDMADAVGLKTGGVHSSGQNALPWYWEGGSWGDAVSELAALDDWPWAVTREAISYDRWDDAWALNFAKENEDLDFPPVYNRCRVFYTTLTGAPRSVRVEASPDPLARFDVDNEYQYDLGESYPNDDIPTAVANALLEDVSSQRVVGTVNIAHGQGRETGRVWTPRRRYRTIAYDDDHYRITPGTRARLQPYPRLGYQRITGVRLRADGVTVEFGQNAEAGALRVLARTALQRSRQRVGKH